METTRATLLFALSGLLAAVGLAYCHAGNALDGEEEPSARDGDPGLPPEVQRATRFYASRPEHERTRPPLPIPAGLPDLSARTCGACHREIYEEWSVSTHRRAWLDDAQFQAELEKNRHLASYVDEEGTTRPGDAGWVCVRCHTPLSDQQPRLVVGLQDDLIARPTYVDNPRYDPELQREAITCAVCHVRDDGVIVGPYGDPLSVAPHPVARDDSLRDGGLCLSCHQAEVRYDDAGLLCAFSTGREWRASRYATEGRACPSCHMPPVERVLAQGGPVRVSGRHFFGGSLIPKRPDLAEELRPLRQLYGSGVDIGVERAGPELRLVVTNSRAGHAVPTGDPERYVLVTARALDATGAVVSETELRLGSVYDWDPPAHLVRDDRLPPGDRRVLALGWAPGAVRLEVVGEKFRIGQEAFDYHRLEGRYVAGRVFHRSTWRLSDGAVELMRLEDDLHAPSVGPAPAAGGAAPTAEEASAGE